MGDKGLEEARRSGRPTKVTAAVRARIVRMAKQLKSAREIARSLAQREGGGLHPSTVARVLKAQKSPFTHAAVTKVQVLSAVNKKKRVAFCRSRVATSQRTRVYLDATGFNWHEGSSPSRRGAWQTAQRPATVTTGKLMCHYFLYGVIGPDYKGPLSFLPPSHEPGSSHPMSATTFKAEHFANYIRNDLAPDLARNFDTMPDVVCDNATQHTSRAAAAAITAAHVPVVASFPPKSFDINPIERVWAVLKQRVDARWNRHPWDSPKGYKRVIIEEWEKIPQRIIAGFIADLPARMKQVIEKGGSWLESPKAFKK